QEVPAPTRATEPRGCHAPPRRARRPHPRRRRPGRAGGGARRRGRRGRGRAPAGAAAPRRAAGGGGRRGEGRGRAGGRAPGAVAAALDRLRAVAATSENLMPATLECARVGVTTGEWAGALREVFGEYRAPTGLASHVSTGDGLASVRERVRLTARELGASRLRLLVGKPGLDGHSNGAEQIAVRARGAGLEVIYQGSRLTPAQIVAAAVQEGVDLVGLSVLSGSHLQAVPEVLAGLREAGVDVPVVVGGIIPAEDAEKLRAAGVARVFTPKDFQVNEIIDDLVTVVREARGLP